MGVPKFYRWISERYPCLSEVVREYQIPEFDNLYLDMNGIIHACSHPNDEDVHFRISEEKIFQDIFRYIEFLFRMIKPRKVFFMAVDGVAPRAKMNQQRGRRFRSAKEAETREEEARQRGETLPNEARFDSNCITPGTEFMDRLHQHLKYFVSMKMTNDEMWQNVRVILSGHETPGEGEHKIMDFIRHEKSSKNYDPNTRHCLYGLDADLIMLGTCSHEPHFSLLREEVKYIRSKNDKRNQRDVNPETITFHLLHLSLFRDYIDHEFSQLKTTLPFPYNLENIIDDWVLMGFLVGNDFIPHIPHFHINKNSLLKLYDAYKKVLPTLDGYLNENGQLNLNRFQKYIEELTEIDIDNFNDNHADLKYIESKGGGKKFGGRLEDTSAFFEDNDLNATQKLIELGDSESNEYESSDSELFMEEFELHKRDYYTNKLMYKHVDKNVLKEQAHEYIRAIQWNLHYYYNGCASWSWFYPHHYAPYISDVNNFSDINLNFDIGDPFKPFEQLLAVLPAASKSLLPNAYQRLVSDPDSQLIDYYPEEFETDMNEKQQAWEAVVLIPFIEEKRLLQAVRSCSSQLSADEVRRNKQGPHLIFTFSPHPQKRFKSPMPSILPDNEKNHANCEELELNGFRLAEHQIYKGLCKGVRLDAFFSGFPTLRHIDHDINITKARVRVFDSASMGENMLLIILNNEQNDIENIARQYLGKCVFANWPHLIEGKVFQVSNEEFKYCLDKNKRLLVEELSDNEYKENYARIVSIERQYKERWGVVIGNTQIIIHVYPLTGRKYVHGVKGRITLTKQWSSIPMVCPLQTVVKDIDVCDQTIQQFKTVEEIYPIGSKCFVLDGQYYGAIAQVMDCKEDNVRVEVYPQLEPDLQEVKERAREIVNDRYMPNYVLAQRLNIHGHLLSRVTGTIFIKPTNKDQRKINIGLNLKFNHRNEYIPGYSLKQDDTWYFSDKVLKLMEEYMNKFPFMFIQLAAIVDKDIFDIDDLIPGENKRQILDKIQQWLKSLPYASEKRQKCNAEILDEFVVEAIEDVVNSHIVFCKEIKPIEQKYKPHQLFRSIHYLGYSLPDPKASYELFDRVVNIRSGISVPLGAKGTIIGKHMDELKEVNTIYDIVFDEEFVGGTALRCTAGKGYKLSPSSLINITYGLKSYGNYDQFVSSQFGQPLQQKFAHSSNSNSQYRRRNPQFASNSPYNNAHQFSFGQRMPHPRSPNVAYANTNYYQQQQPLNHSNNSPFHSLTKQEPDTRQTKENVWNDFSKLKLSNANLSTSPKNTNYSKQVNEKEKLVAKSTKQPDYRDNRDKAKYNDSAKKSNNFVKLFDSFKHILIKQCEKVFNQKPRFETTTVGPMKSKTAKIVLPDSKTFNLVLNSFPTSEEVFDKLSESALEYMNGKYNTNVNLTRTGKLVSSPSFLHSTQLSQNEPKISASYLPRPPSVWIPRNIKRKESESEQFIPESFVEENNRLLRELQRTQKIVNTANNKEKQAHSNAFVHDSQNASNYGNVQQTFRHQSPFNEQSDARNASGSQYQQKHDKNRPYYGYNSNLAAFDNQFIPLQVARNNQTQRIQAKKSPELSSQAKQSEKVILTPETISVSSDDVEII